MFSIHRLLFAAAFAVPLGVLALAGWLNFRQVYVEAEREAQHTVAALSEHAQRTFRAHELILGFVDRYTEGRGWQELSASPDTHRLLLRLLEKSPDVASIFLLDPQGQLFISSRRFPMPRIDASDREYFLALRERDFLHVSRPTTGRLSSDRFFSVARRRSASDGRFDGLIAVSVNPAYFERFYAGLRLTAEDTVGLVRADGVLLARNPPLPQEGIVLPAGSPFMRMVQVQPVSGQFTAESIADGVERIYAYRRVGDYPVYVSFNTSMTLVWSEWRAVMLPYVLACLLALGMLLAAVALAEQRTRRTAAEARSREAEQASRAKDLFVAALSHELRNPLSAISNASEALQRSGPVEPGVRMAADIIARQIVQLRRMLDDLLDTARSVYGKLRLEKRRVDLRAIAQTVVAEQLARSSVAAAIEVSGGDPWIDGDPVRLKQMVGNLVENAIKYGARRIDITIEAAGEWIELSVRDDGQGIAAELLPRLFEPFVQGEQKLDRAQGGLGLGLALVNRLAAMHGGSLTAASDGPGRGSRFTLRLPRAEAPARRVELAAVGAEARKRRMLLVDDQEDARDSLRALLQQEGHEVTAAADGPSALAALAASPVEVALIDIGLPGMDGYELARRVHEAQPSVALVAITGYGQPQDRERAHGAGFDVHLTKPFSYEELMSALAHIERRAAA
jgi:signal transduction histidine kinase/CheY-like chemotaxis protein